MTIRIARKERKRDDEAGTRAGPVAMRLHRTAVQIDHSFHQRKAKAQTALAAPEARIALAEGQEQAIEEAERNAHTVVLDAEARFARADIAVGSTVGATLPQTAVLNDDRGTYVLVVGNDNKVERRAVRIAGARSEGLLVSAGLTGTERVVAIAGAFLRPGELVSTVLAKAAS